jgi:hypothetical protein
MIAVLARCPRRSRPWSSVDTDRRSATRRRASSRLDDRRPLPRLSNPAVKISMPGATAPPVNDSPSHRDEVHHRTAWFEQHPKTPWVSEKILLGAVQWFFGERVFGPHRTDPPRAQPTAASSAASSDDDKKAEQLRSEIKTIERRKERLLDELDGHDEDRDPASRRVPPEHPPALRPPRTQAPRAAHPAPPGRTEQEMPGAAERGPHRGTAAARGEPGRAARSRAASPPRCLPA